MPELKSTLDGVSREQKILAYTVNLASGKCVITTQVALGWVSGADSKCLSTSFEDITLSLDDLPELVAGIEIIYKKLEVSDVVYLASVKPAEVAPVEEVK